MMRHQIIVIGASVGGLAALQALLPQLPEDYSLPLVVVQHRGKDSDDELRKFLQRSSKLPVIEPNDKEIIEPGRVYLAPSDYHLLIEKGTFALSTESPVSYARPSINVLFESAADAYQQYVVGVVLTGANADGASGLAKIKACGGLTIVEDPATAGVRAMPEAAIAAATAAAAPVDQVLPLNEIARFLTNLCCSNQEVMYARRTPRH